MSAARDGLQLNFLEAGGALLHGLVLQMTNATLAGTAGDDSDVPASVLVVRVGLPPVDARLGGVGLNFACGELDVLRVPPMLPRTRLYIYIYIYIYTYIHTYIRTCIQYHTIPYHTYIHTYIYAYLHISTR